jgi:hypothetical protein
MNKIVIAASIAGIAVAISLAVGYFVYANPVSNPWDGMTCEEMTNLAMSPEHQTFTEQQHMQFHMKLNPCIESMNNMHQ